jgi:hypothetical protein
MEEAVPEKKLSRKRRTEYHNALTDIFNSLMADPLKNGDAEIGDELRLSKAPLRIDLIITKKNESAEMKSRVCKIFRRYNIIEYKSPAADPPSLKDFNKVLGYTNIYAWEKEISVTEMTATIICFKKTTELLETLKNDLGYKILRKHPGIYYILHKGTPAEKMLGMQIVVSPELPESEFVLKVIGAKLDRKGMRKAWDLYCQNPDGLEYWWEIILQNSDNYKLFIRKKDGEDGRSSSREKT